MSHILDVKRGVFLLVLLLLANIFISLLNNQGESQQCGTGDSGVTLNEDPTNYIQAPHVSFDFICNEQGLFIPGVSCAKATGSSMQPSAWTGNTQVWKKYERGAELKEGMIISYQGESGKTSHRIRAIYPDYVRVQGDNTMNDEKVAYNRIVNTRVGLLDT